MKVRIAICTILALGLALGTSGCNLIQPQATTNSYNASDGIGVNVGDIQLRNLIVISNDGKTGSLVMSAINTTGFDVFLHIQFLSKGAMVNGTLMVPNAQTATQWGDLGQDKIVFEGIDSAPGSMLEIYFQYGTADGVTTLVPVLTTGQPEYAGLEPNIVLDLGTK